MERLASLKARLRGAPKRWSKRCRRSWRPCCRPCYWRSWKLTNSKAPQRRGELDPDIITYAEASIAAEEARVAAAQRAKEEALRRELERSKRIAAIVSGLLVLALVAGAFAWWQRNVATAALLQAEENY